MKTIKEINNLINEIKRSYDIVSLYPEIKKLIRRDGGDFNKFIKIFDRMEGDYDNTDIYAIRDAISDALDKSNIMFSYDKLTSITNKNLRR